uniref:Uncharacterized protein n=2 Tax=Aegilops tauschii subsp. strangulata TaxID=200361 RepID=A0A452XIX5_AEGTS
GWNRGPQPGAKKFLSRGRNERLGPTWSRQEGPGAPPSVAGRTSTAATQASPWTQGGVEEKQLAWTFRFSLMSEKKVRLRCSDIQEACDAFKIHENQYCGPPCGHPAVEVIV